MLASVYSINIIQLWVWNQLWKYISDLFSTVKSYLQSNVYIWVCSVKLSVGTRGTVIFIIVAGIFRVSVLKNYALVFYWAWVFLNKLKCQRVCGSETCLRFITLKGSNIKWFQKNCLWNANTTWSTVGKPRRTIQKCMFYDLT